MAGSFRGLVLIAACGAFEAAAADGAGAAAQPPAPPLASQPGAQAVSPPAAAPISPQYAELAKKLHKALPEFSIDGIQPSGVEGIVEVLAGGHRIFYSDLAGQHIFNGHLFALDTHEDLTESRLAALTRVDVKMLPLTDAFDVVHGSGKRAIYIFEDPDCPYCKQFEEQLPKVDDVTLHIFLYPLTSVHPHAYQHALGIWCAKDRQRAWLDKMLKGVDPPVAKCANPIDRNIALGDKLHIDGTPTLVFADGRTHAGTVTSQELEQLLAGKSD
jgi:thiol:disulfide interchange protein DsbC